MEKKEGAQAAERETKYAGIKIEFRYANGARGVLMRRMTAQDRARLKRIQAVLDGRVKEYAPNIEKLRYDVFDIYRDYTGMEHYDWSFIRDYREVAKAIDDAVGVWAVV